MDDKVRADVEIIEQHEDLLGTRESLYVKRPRVVHEEKDLSYFNFVAQNEARKGVVGVFGHPGAGKSSLIRMLGNGSVVRGSRHIPVTKTMYEEQRETTIHVHPSVVFASGEDGTSRILTLLDTSGHMDFIAETVSVVHKIDTAVMVFDVQGALSLWHEVMLGSINLVDKPLVVVLNGVDSRAVGQSRSDLVGKIKYFKDSIMKVLNPSRFFVASADFSAILAMNEPTCEWFDEFSGHCGVSDDFFVQLLCRDVFEYRHISDCVSYNPRVLHDKCSDNVLGFLPVGDSILCTLITDCVLKAGSLIRIASEELLVERMYLPFPGCLVESESVSANIGVLVKLKEYPVSGGVCLRGHVNLSQILRDIIDPKGGARSMVSSKEFDPCIKVLVEPEMEEEFGESIKKLSLIYRGLKADRHILSGYGELFMDAVIHDLRKVFNVSFDVLCVFVNLKEAFVDHFEERMNVGKQVVVIKGGISEHRKEGEKASDLENALMEMGPLMGETIVNGYLDITGPMQSMDLLNRVSDVLVKHTVLLEPFCVMEVIYMPDAEELVDEAICSSRGSVFHRTSQPHSPLRRVLAYIPVAECFGFETDLRVYSCSLADCSSIFSHLEYVTEDRIHELVKFVRKAKKLDGF